MKTVIMPLNANIPGEWVAGWTDKSFTIAVPSWSKKGETYDVEMMLEDRSLRCDCLGFKFRGDCHHVRGLIWFCCRPEGRRGVRTTSRMAFEEIKPELMERQGAVYAWLKDAGPRSDRAISDGMGIPINCVTPRRGELVEMGMVEFHGYGTDPNTNKKVMIWKAVC